MLPDTGSSPPADDTALVTALRKGEYSAFETIYRNEFPALYRYAASLVSHDDAVDSVQDVFFAVWNNRVELPVQQENDLSDSRDDLSGIVEQVIAELPPGKGLSTSGKTISAMSYVGCMKRQKKI